MICPVMIVTVTMMSHHKCSSRKTVQGMIEIVIVIRTTNRMVIMGMRPQMFDST